MDDPNDLYNYVKRNPYIVASFLEEMGVEVAEIMGCMEDFS